MIPHPSWIELSPRIDSDGNPEWFDEYYERIKLIPKFQNLPEVLLEQWIHAHYDHPEMVKNYSWMDYTSVGIELVEFGMADLLNLNVLDSFQDYVEVRSRYRNFDQFAVRREISVYGKMKGHGEHLQ